MSSSTPPTSLQSANAIVALLDEITQLATTSPSALNEFAKFQRAFVSVAETLQPDPGLHARAIQVLELVCGANTTSSRKRARVNDDDAALPPPSSLQEGLSILKSSDEHHINMTFLRTLTSFRVSRSILKNSDCVNIMLQFASSLPPEDLRAEFIHEKIEKWKKVM